MATGKSDETGDAVTAPAAMTRQPSHWKRNTVLLVLLGLAIGLAFGWSALATRARAVTAFAAETGCACRYVAARPLDDCDETLRAAPLSRLRHLVRTDADGAARTFEASVPLLASETAQFEPRYGCRLAPWED